MPSPVEVVAQGAVAVSKLHDDRADVTREFRQGGECLGRRRVATNSAMGARFIKILGRRFDGGADSRFNGRGRDFEGAEALIGARWNSRGQLRIDVRFLVSNDPFMSRDPVEMKPSRALADKGLGLVGNGREGLVRLGCGGAWRDLSEP
jgi:hypothetical protein